MAALSLVSVSEAVGQILRNDLVVLSIGGDTLAYPWTGGMNAPQFSVDDFDDDGRNDLIVYDRQDHTVFFLSAMRKHEPAWESILGNVAFTDFLMVRDFDADGRGDLFTGHYNAVRVWRNEAKPGRMARYRLFSDPLKSNYYDSSLILYCAGIDLPGVADMDGDGDLDLTVYDVGGTKVEYHRNLAVENHNRLDIFDFELASACWGHFYEYYDAQANTNTLMLHQPPCDGEFKVTHAGGTLLPIQLNGDTLMDLITGDFGVPTVNAVINAGNRRIAHADFAIHNFPPAHPINVRYFPAMYHFDANGDGVRDLVSAPNQPDVSEDYLCAIVHYNHGGDLHPAFTEQPEIFLQNQMLDWGSATNVARVGEDLLVFYERFGQNKAGVARMFRDGGGGYRISESGLPTIPDNVFAPAPSAADLDADGDDDLVLGTGSGKAWTWENLGNGAWAAPVDTFFFVPTGARYTSPALADVDDDGDFDAVLGVGRGTLLFYENVGTPQKPVFAPPVSDWGAVEVTDSINTFNGRAAPTFVELDGDPQPELLVGNASGVLRLFDNVSKTGDFVDKGLWTNRRLGINLRATIAAQTVASDTFSATDSLTWVAGTARGGLILFASPGRMPVKRDTVIVERGHAQNPPSFYLWPNAFEDKVWVRAPHPGEVLVFDATGRKRAFFAVSGDTEQELGFLPPGLYLFQFSGGGGVRGVKR